MNKFKFIAEEKIKKQRKQNKKLRMKPYLQECLNNKKHSHWALRDSDTGIVLWEELCQK